MYRLLLLLTFFLFTASPSNAQKFPGDKALKKSSKALSKRQYTLALTHINQAIREDSSNALFYHIRSVIYFEMDSLSPAITNEKKAIALDPANDQSHFLLGSLYYLRGRPEDSSEIEKCYTNAIAFNKSNAEAYYLRGLYYAEHRQPQKALNDYSKSITIDPTKADVYFQMANIKCNTYSYYGEAITDLKKAIELDPNNPDYYSGIADCYFKLGDIEMTRLYVSKASELGPHSISVMLLQAHLLDIDGKVTEAMALLDEIIKRDSLDFGAYNNRGIIKIFKTKEYESGIEDLKKALALNADSYMIHNNIGLGYAALERYPEAIEEYNVVITNQPKDVLSFSYNNRGYAKMKMKDYEGAFADILTSLQIDPKNSYAFRNRALLYLELNKPEDACVDLKHAQELNFSLYYGPEVDELIQQHCH